MRKNHQTSCPISHRHAVARNCRSALSTSFWNWRSIALGISRYAVLIFCALMLSGCDRATLRKWISWIVRPNHSKPQVYHEYEGYSPGATKSTVVEDFSRYYYYIAPNEEEMRNSDPEIYFRQDYEAIEPQVSFDEEQYWREHPLQLDNDAPPATTSNPSE